MEEPSLLSLADSGSATWKLDDWVDGQGGGGGGGGEALLERSVGGDDDVVCD